MDAGIGIEGLGHHDLPRSLQELAPSIKTIMFWLLQYKLPLG